ncbi:MAG TPA: ABC transporter ATP-binding protein [Patescibacteria group bacterium]|nr:ABC transporter ATP-binding protein [Patescibacteria group bacterium]
MNSKKLIIKNISKSYEKGKLRVLDNVSLSIDDGEFVSILGPSGCGKSTILDIISGLANADSGDVLLNGESIKNTTGKVAYMTQDDVLFPWRTVLDNVIIPLEIAGVEKKLAREESKKLLHIFGLDKFAASFPFMLSGGMRQRAALLRTYLTKKNVLLFDEPFAKLDALTRKNMQEWFLHIWQKDKRSVLFVTHDIDEAILLSDKIYVMSDRPGKIVKEILINSKRPRRNIAKDFATMKKKILTNLL